MPRKSRIDAAGALHHIIARGIDRGKPFQDPTDKRNFLGRLGEILKVFYVIGQTASWGSVCRSCLAE